MTFRQVGSATRSRNAVAIDGHFDRYNGIRCREELSCGPEGAAMVVNRPWNDQERATQNEFMMHYVSSWHSGLLPNGAPTQRDPRQLTRLGLTNLCGGMASLARECFELALPQLLWELGPEGPAETRDTFVHVADLSQSTLPAGEGASGSTVTWGWSPIMKSDSWLCVMLCGWFLEKRHDAEAIRRCSDEIHRSDQDNSKHAFDGVCLEESTPRHCAAGEDERCLWYLERAKRFTPPGRPNLVRSERAMAYVLARHRKEGFWNEQDVAEAWQTFLRLFVPKLLNGGRTMHLALWMKLAFWDTDPQREPEAAFLKFWEFIPGATSAQA